MSKLAGYTKNSCTSEQRPTVLICDEFAALLDRVTAAVIAHALRRAVTAESGVAAVVATSHDDLIDALKPDCRVRCDFGTVSILEKTSVPTS